MALPALLLTWTLLEPAAAAEATPTAEPATAHEDAEAEHGEHAPHAHHVAIFLGATRLEHETAPSVGLDYLYFLPVLDRRLGVGPLADATFAEHVELVVGLAFAARGPVGLQLALAPVVALADGHKEFGARVNLSHGFHFAERFSVGPSLSADFLPHTMAYVFGLNGGVGF